MRYCLECGSATVEFKIPPGDTRPRHICQACAYIHYENPRNIAGCILVWQQKILLCQRAIEPRLGFWTIPAGFMENGETLSEAAAREAWEEAAARANNLRLHSIHSLPHISQVYAVFHGELVDGHHAVGVESLATGLFSPAEIPWDKLAFPVITETLQLYLRDQQRVHSGDIVRHADGSLEYRRQDH